MYYFQKFPGVKTGNQVQGRDASANEFNVAWALDRMKKPYIFQYAPFGVQGIKGQYIVDFLVLGAIVTPLEVFGEYWHGGKLSSADKLRLWILEQYFKREIVVVWGEESETRDKALVTLRAKLGQGL